MKKIHPYAYGSLIECAESFVIMCDSCPNEHPIIEGTPGRVRYATPNAITVDFEIFSDDTGQVSYWEARLRNDMIARHVRLRGKMVLT